MKIGLLSDTHGFLDPRIWPHLQDCDQLWHAGDIGSMEVAQALAKRKPLIAVHGNIDGDAIRKAYGANQHFVCEGLKVWLTHIAGRPGAYAPAVVAGLAQHRPNLLVAGHTHLLSVMRIKPGCYHLNPGAAGKQGCHQVQTLLTFQITAGKLLKMQAIELTKGDQN